MTFDEWYTEFIDEAPDREDFLAWTLKNLMQAAWKEGYEQGMGDADDFLVGAKRC